MSGAKRWLGSEPTQCQLCEAPLADHDHFIDGKIRQGPWALLCPPCHEKEGVGLGLGMGQSYETKAPYLKIAG